LPAYFRCAPPIKKRKAENLHRNHRKIEVNRIGGGGGGVFINGEIEVEEREGLIINGKKADWENLTREKA
jgi:hypothetical protein